MTGDVIVACATGWSRAAIAVVRLSGPGTRDLLDTFCAPAGGRPPPRRARLCRFFDADGPFDEGLLTWFSEGSSYTGEESAELSCHGNPLLVERLVQAAVAAGARVADPGEFTRRALLHGRLDATRAEAVLQAVEATSARGLEVARAGLDGAVSALTEALRVGLTDAVAELEAWLDHGDDELALMPEAELHRVLEDLEGRALEAAATYRAGSAWVDGARVALVGPVNAGKSSLFNALGGSVRALVSAAPGTTRDLLERRVELHGVPVTLLDTAGDRESTGLDDLGTIGEPLRGPLPPLSARGRAWKSGAMPAAPPDQQGRKLPRAPAHHSCRGHLEAEGIALGRALSDDADLFVVVVPAHAPQQAAEVLARTAGRPRLLVGNHADRAGAVAEVDGQPLLPTCALDGTGLDTLGRALVAALVGETPGEAAVVIASVRQRDLLLAVGASLVGCRRALQDGAGPAVAAEELNRGLERLAELDGRDVREEALDALFRRFCIGK